MRFCSFTTAWPIIESAGLFLFNRRSSVAFCVLGLAIFGLGRLNAAETQSRPNIIFVLADDLGWSELGCYGNGFNETPNLDRLAAEGVKFHQAYAAAPVCSPYRASLLTGQHPARLGILDYLRPNSANALSTRHRTLAGMLKQNGYATGMIGKWHLSGYRYQQAEYEVRPTDHGFEWNIGSEVKGVGNGANFWPYVFRKQPIPWVDLAEKRMGDNEYLTDRLNLEAVDFIERNKERPFFLYLSHYAPHTILNGRPELVEKYRRKHPPGVSTRSRCYLCEDSGRKDDALNHWAGDHNPHLAAMLESIDDGIGKIVAKLEELGLSENTILIFTSDNGGETNVTSNAPLRGGKSQLYEGGVRVPLIIRWTNGLPVGTTCDQPTMNVDFLPTLLEATGVPTSDDSPLDGQSQLDVWRNPSASASRRTLYWHYPLDRPHFLGGVSAGAIRHGDWKLIEFFDDNRVELYSLADDPSEQRNIAAKHSQTVSKLKAKLAAWRAKAAARQPSPPLLAEPRRLSFADHFSSERASERWFFSQEWSVADGALQRSPGGTDVTRIFLRETKFKDAVVRFDFQMQETRDLRLVTGSSGHYNTVIHIRPDHFFVQTAQDPTGPYFSYRHGECAFRFDPARWYTMTVEFVGDQVVAHLDPQHVAYGKHPILDQPRTYFAFQVDERPAAFDNVQILEAGKHPEHAANSHHIAAVSGKHPVERPIAEQLEIQRRNSHEWFFQRDAAYRKLVQRVDEWDRVKIQRFPAVFRTNKSVRKQIAEQRKKLLTEDSQFKETLFATHRAKRAITAWLVAREPRIGELPDSRRKREIEMLRRRYEETAGYKQLVATRDAAQRKLESDYPQLFISDQELRERRSKEREVAKNNPEFRRLTKERADAYHAQQAYLVANDPRLADLTRKLNAKRQ